MLTLITKIINIKLFILTRDLLILLHHHHQFRNLLAFPGGLHLGLIPLRELICPNLSFETVYSHEIILIWLQEILPAWLIHIPETGVSALSEWPKNGKSRNSVKQWLQEQNHGNPDDLIDGACEPLAYHLSSKMSQNHWIIGLRKQFREIKDELEELDPQVAANVIFGEYIKHKIPSTTQFWGQQTLGLSYEHYLFGHSLSRIRIQ